MTSTYRGSASAVAEVWDEWDEGWDVGDWEGVWGESGGVVIPFRTRESTDAATHATPNPQTYPQQPVENPQPEPEQTPPHQPKRIPTGTWHDHANCLGKTDHMFPKEYKDITYIRQARQICRECTVREPCLDYALEFPAADMHGVWAGLTPRQLAAEQRKRGIRPSRPSLSVAWNDGI